MPFNSAIFLMDDIRLNPGLRKLRIKWAGSWKKEAGCYYSSDGNTENDYYLRVSQLPAFNIRFQTYLKTGSFYPEFTLL